MLKQTIEKKKKSTKGVAAIVTSTGKARFCPLCSVPMNYDDGKESKEKAWDCPRCGYKAHPELSQIALSKTELKASNDFYHNRTRVFLGSPSRTGRRIANASIMKKTYSKSNNVYQSLAEAEEATYIAHDYDKS